ncbi:MAG: glycosyl hydrolase family 2 [Ignavibacteriales bacterium]|nr:glycosyl hydrolase family 2 [Ignavibacteriales bacterium]
MKKVFFFLMAIVLMVNAQNKIEMPAIFSDNMVLQQKSLAPFWGKAKPGEKVFIKTGWGASANTKAGDDSLWQTKIRTPKAGGPYEIKIQIGDSAIVYKNVMTGEVWICSGQSNMEMPLEGWPPNDTISGASQEIPNANYPAIRLFTVTRAYSTEQQFNCTGSWTECSQQTAAHFSATAFFFGKKLYEELKVPIGLIHTSWGGTPVEAWTSGKYLSQIEKYKTILSLLDESKTEFVKLKNWLAEKPVIDMNGKNGESQWMNLDFEDSVCSSANYNDSLWKEMNLPRNWENTEVGNFDGVIWFRKKIEIPENWINKELVLELGAIDDMDATYANGMKVGGYEKDGFWQTDRVYAVPAEVVKEKFVTIAVRVMDNQGGGGIWGAAEKLLIHPKDTDEKISLAGNWKYLPIAEYASGKFFVFGAAHEEFNHRPKLPVDLSPYTPSVLYNAMIAPIVPYSIKGAIWYQGESNTDDSEGYKKLFPLMINNWRDDWKQDDFPFYFTQIAPFKYSTGTNSQKLREAQFVSLSVPKTGMAVTLDIGNPDNIHPANKKDVGGRLALWALKKDYNKKNVCSGPLYKSMKIEKGKIILSFEYADGGLILKERDGENNFTIAGADKIFKKAEIKIEGKKLILSNSEISDPTAVRYCWDDISEGTLFNNAGLPASSFRTGNWNE